MTSPDPLRYPIGHYHPPQDIQRSHLDQWIDTLAAFPRKMDELVRSLNDTQLDTPYRPDGWTVRQLVHHVADSHMNSYIRFKWTMTEDNPKIKSYNQDLWAEQPDGMSAPANLSLDLLTALHARWVYYLRSLSDEDFTRTFYHPEMNQEIRLDWLLGMYAWHCDHHYAHVAGLVARMD